MRRVLAWIGWSLVFGLAYTQAPLFYSNQNQYFLHGLAQAGRGLLDEDWLANTRDPTPLFSAFVSVVGRHFDERLFNAVYIALLGINFTSLLCVAEFVLRKPAADAVAEPDGGISTNLVTGKKHEHAAALLVVATLLIAMHSGILRLASARALGIDYPWYFQAGVAGQYLLGFGLQPSAFGVLLLASLALFLGTRPWGAVTVACLAAVLHATYLLAAGMLVFSYLVLLTRAGRWKFAGILGLWALLLVAPVVVYSVSNFGPTDATTFAEAQDILAHVRIPHHAEPERWFDAIAAAQVAWIVFGMLLVWRTPLFSIMALVFLLSLAGTLAQVISGSATLALLFPWRTSAILVPLATTIIFTLFVAGAGNWLSRRGRVVLGTACGFMLGFCLVGGLAIMALNWGFPTSAEELPLLDYVKAHKQRGDVYLLPVELPKAPRGARSTNFTPAPRRGGGKLIAIDLQRFRLDTGAPIYVDFKSIPYKDAEVLEWHRRLLEALQIYRLAESNDPELLRNLERERITHVVVPADRHLSSRALKVEYEDAAYRLYRVRRLQ